MIRLQSPLFGENAYLECFFLQGFVLGYASYGSLGVSVACSDSVYFSDIICPIFFFSICSSDPGFLAKNEWEDHLLGPVIIPSWSVGSRSHSLCPVAASWRRMDANSQAHFPSGSGKIRFVLAQWCTLLWCSVRLIRLRIWARCLELMMSNKWLLHWPS